MSEKDKKVEVDLEGMKYRITGSYVFHQLLPFFHSGTYVVPPESNDIDYVVEGETAESMERRGFNPAVGNEFPVFINPEDGNEWSLCRTEVKVPVIVGGNPHTSFRTVCSPDVTFKQDAQRRHLAEFALQLDPNDIDEQGDPGIDDFCEGAFGIQAAVFHACNPKTFSDDPLRVLITATKLSRYPIFSTDEELDDAARLCVQNGELKNLTPERVWMELEKILAGDMPSKGMKWLDHVGALEVVFPELFALKGVLQPEQYHPEGDAWVHVLQCIDRAAFFTDRRAQFAALAHDLGKTLTPKELWPKHFRHEQNGVALVTAFCERLKVPKDTQFVAEKACLLHGKAHEALQMKTGKVVDFLMEISKGLLVGRENNIGLANSIIAVCQFDAEGRRVDDKGPIPDYPQSSFLYKALCICLEYSNKDVFALKKRDGSFKFPKPEDKAKLTAYFKEIVPPALREIRGNAIKQLQSDMKK